MTIDANELEGMDASLLQEKYESTVAGQKNAREVQSLQGCLAHKKQSTPLEPPQGPRHRLQEEVQEHRGGPEEGPVAPATLSSHLAFCRVQGYLTNEKSHPPRTQP